MKLLAELQKQVSGMGRLRYAWFTSFNTDIEFVETFVLPVTLGANVPRNRLEYEQLQQELTDKGIDFRVFCDPRFLETNRVKRTCIPVHGVRPERASEWFSEKSLFHPKVIYLEDEGGKRVIGAGSANLTLSGWGRNIEAFRFFEVTTHANYRSIRHFFNQLCLAADIPCELADRRNFTQQQEKWHFVHSYQEQTFPEQLFGGGNNEDLVVWSPYLPRNLATFVDRLQVVSGLDSLRVHLVPDRIEGKYLGTEWSEELSEMKALGRITFYTNPTARHPSTELCHAKLWKFSGKLAVGSWNFTGPGSNILHDQKGKWSRDNNVEAGFIINDRNDWRDACGKRLDLGSDDCASNELLVKESLVVDPLPPFDLHVSFDWRAHAYVFSGQWLDNRSRDGYLVRLPGVERAVPLEWNAHRRPVQPGELRVDDGALLRDRIFTVYQGDNQVQRSVVSELNTKSRRVQSFETLHDLLETFVHGDDPQSLHDLPFRIRFDTDAFPDETVFATTDLGVMLDSDIRPRESISYFRLFRSMLAYQQKLSNLIKLEDLDHQVFSWPGCLLELVGMVTVELMQPGREVFNWFLSNEVHSLCKFAHTRRRSLVRGARERECGYEPVPEARWQELMFELPDPPAGVPPEYFKLVIEQCHHG